jgi:hypothetical protein
MLPPTLSLNMSPHADMWTNIAYREVGPELFLRFCLLRLTSATSSPTRTERSPTCTAAVVLLLPVLSRNTIAPPLPQALPARPTPHPYPLSRRTKCFFSSTYFVSHPLRLHPPEPNARLLELPPPPYSSLSSLVTRSLLLSLKRCRHALLLVPILSRDTEPIHPP